ncbi:MAG: hypothetical protein ABI024_06910 [Vicinamibacterales bacterium]
MGRLIDLDGLVRDRRVAEVDAAHHHVIARLAVEHIGSRTGTMSTSISYK